MCQARDEGVGHVVQLVRSEMQLPPPTLTTTIHIDECTVVRENHMVLCHPHFLEFPKEMCAAFATMRTLPIFYMETETLPYVTNPRLAAAWAMGGSTRKMCVSYI